MSGHHDHDHHHLDDELALRAAALEAALVDKGLVTTDQIDALVERYERDLGPQNGARVVARAWVDTAYRERLRMNGSAAIRELGYGGFEGDTMVVLENTPEVHNVVVSTTCARRARGLYSHRKRQQPGIQKALNQRMTEHLGAPRCDGGHVHIATTPAEHSP